MQWFCYSTNFEIWKACSFDPKRLIASVKECITRLQLLKSHTQCLYMCPVKVVLRPSGRFIIDGTCPAMAHPPNTYSILDLAIMPSVE